MKPATPKSHTNALGVMFRLLVVAALAALLSIPSVAQEQRAEKVTDGTTPSGLASGAPAGSYALSGFESVNPYNGGLNFSLPLLTVGGRGGAGYPVTLRIDQKWIIRKQFGDNEGDKRLQWRRLEEGKIRFAGEKPVVLLTPPVSPIRRQGMR